jgi:hypothetical protein
MRREDNLKIKVENLRLLYRSPSKSNLIWVHLGPGVKTSIGQTDLQIQNTKIVSFLVSVEEVAFVAEKIINGNAGGVDNNVAFWCFSMHQSWFWKEEWDGGKISTLKRLILLSPDPTKLTAPFDDLD